MHTKKLGQLPISQGKIQYNEQSSMKGRNRNVIIMKNLPCWYKVFSSLNSSFKK